MAAPLTKCDALPAFLVEGKIGEGTFGEVFLIRHARRRERVFALKRNKARHPSLRVPYAVRARSRGGKRPEHAR